MRFPRGLLFLLLVVPALAGCFAGPADPDEPGASPSRAHLFWNGLVWTGNMAAPEADALVVLNGTLAFVGTEGEARAAFPDADETDLGGRRVIPGMIDSHSHFVRVAAAWNCDPAKDPFKPTYDTSQLAGTEYEISRAQIGANHAQTNASGKTPVDDRANLADKAAAARGLECAMHEANAMGLTMNVEAGTPGWDYLDVLQDLEKQEKVTMRHSLYIVPPLLEEAKQRGVRTGYGTDLVRVAGIKFYSDGWLGPRSSALLAPYSDRPTSRGVLFLEQAEANSWVERGNAAGLKIATHTIGDQGVAVLLEAYKRISNATADGKELRFAFEHAQVLNPRLVDGIAAIHGVVSYQLSFATTDQKFAEQALGPERVKNAYLWKTLLDRGVVLAGGSDFPIEVLPPLWGLQRVVTRQELDGTPPGGWHPEQKLSIEEALRTITWNAAYNVFMEDRLGSLEAGKLADFVVLDQDILTIPPTDIAKTCVRATYVGGRLVYDGAGPESQCARVKFAGELPHRDPDAMIRLHEQLEDEALHRASMASRPFQVLSVDE